MLFSISADCPRDLWVRAGMFAHAAGLAFEDFDAWSAGGKTYDARDARDTWDSFHAGDIGPGSLYYLATTVGTYRPDPAAPRHSPPTPAEREQRAAAEAQRARRRTIPPDPDFQPAAIWARCIPATADYPYIAAKGGIPDGLRVVPAGHRLRQLRESLAGWLVVPVWPDGHVGETPSTLVFIAPPDVAARLKAAGKPSKMNLDGHRLEGYFVVGECPPGGVFYIVEGIGTGWAVHKATGNAAVVAFGWGNVRRVARAYRERDPAARLVLAPDVGKEPDAHVIARELGATVVAMPPGWPQNADLNDLAQRDGIEALRALLAGAYDQAPPPAADPVPAADPPPVANARPPDDDTADESKVGRRVSALDVALALTADIELSHDAGGTGYFAAEYDGRREVWAIQSRAGADLVQRRYLASTGRGLPAQSLKDVLATLDARARFEGSQRDVFLRVARFPDRVLIDLADDRWRVLEVTAAGWRVLDRSPVPFVRRAGMASLPEPQRGGSVAELRKFVNVAEAEFRLVVAWLLGALGGRGPFPVLVLQAEQGAGKSTAARVLRALVDPADVPLKAPPRTADDWVIAAAVSYVLALDNLSGLTNDQSDMLCRLATAAGVSKRRLYTDLDEVQLHLCRPALLNGIDAIATRPDLADRSLVVTLPTIPAARRRREAAFWEAFEAARPRLLGALLDAVAGALRCSGNAPPPDLPRMADFAAWISAAEPALGWPTGAFLAAYVENIEGAAEAAVEASPVGVAVLSLLSRYPSVTYVATALMPALEHAAPDWAPRSPAWPRSPRRLTDSLRRLTAPLRQLGIEVFEHRDARGRWITLRRLSQPSANSPGLSA